MNNQQYNQGYDQNQNYNQYSQQGYAAFDEQTSIQQPSQQQNNDQINQQGQQQQSQLWYAPPEVPTKLADLEFDLRSGFVKKVYALLTLELGSTLLLCYFMMNTGFGNLFVTIDYYHGDYQSIKLTPLYFISMIMSFFLQIALFCCSNLSRKVPVNYILLTLYVTFMGFMIGGMSQVVNLSYQDDGGQALVWSAWLITFSLVLCLTAYACTTKTDISMKAGFIFVLIGPLMTCCILSIFFYSKVLEIMICGMVIVLYGFYLIFETQMIMGGTRVKLSIDDYVIGSLLLYGTIVQLFIRILEILVLRKR